MIGIQDPFPLENDFGKTVKKLPKDFSDLAYHKSRYANNNSPKCIYFPSRYIMFKLMRASIAVQSVDELWFISREPLVTTSSIHADEPATNKQE